MHCTAPNLKIPRSQRCVIPRPLATDTHPKDSPDYRHSISYCTKIVPGCVLLCHSCLIFSGLQCAVCSYTRHYCVADGTAVALRSFHTAPRLGGGQIKSEGGNARARNYAHRYHISTEPKYFPFIQESTLNVTFPAIFSRNNEV
jgi:hypothetical protein